MAMYQRILVATDGSELSELAVHSAIDLALLMQAELVAIKVVRRDPTGYFEGSVLLERRMPIA
jgi:nucleotide-binding universal stress UspA family protein